MKAGVTKSGLLMNELVEPPPHFRPIVGSKPLTRREVMERLQEYIHENKCYCLKHPTMVNADPLLEAIFGKKRFRVFDTLRVAKAIPSTRKQ